MITFLLSVELTNTISVAYVPFLSLTCHPRLLTASTTIVGAADLIWGSPRARHRSKHWVC